MNIDTQKDKYFMRNAAGVSLVEFIWGLGFPILLESTFLQIFLKTLGASDFIIGLVPCIFITGISIFPLLSSYLTRNQQSKKKVVISLHILSSLAIILFGISLFFVTTPSFILVLFFLSYAAFSLSLGLTLPVWLNFLVKIFSEKKNISGLGIMMSSQSTAKLISSFAIIKVVEGFGFSTSSAAWIFLISGLLFLLGSFCFLFTREISSRDTMPVNHESFFKHTKSSLAEIIKNKNFLKYLAGDLDNYIIITTISFYAVYATQYFNISPSTAAGGFVGFYYTGSIFANLLLGPFNVFKFMDLRRKFISTKVFTITGLLILILQPCVPGFFTASFIFGIVRGTRNIIFSPAVKKFSGKEDSTGYFAITPLLTIIFGSGLPVFYGAFLDLFSGMEANAYKIMFSISILLTLVIFYFAVITDFSKKENLK